MVGCSMKSRNYSTHFSLSRLAAALFSACLLPVQAGMIVSQQSASGSAGHGGWNLDNVNVRIVKGNGNTDPGGSFNPGNGAYKLGDDGLYVSDVYNTDYIHGNSPKKLMATIVAKDWPIGEPPGIKVINDDPGVKAPRPQNCIMSTSHLAPDLLDTANPVQVTCSSPFQSHKRFKIRLQPTLVDGIGEESVDLVFNVIDEPGSRDYQVFQKINNWTDERLQGFSLQVGFGVGSGFLSTSGSGKALADLSISVPGEVWDADQLAIFSHGLFGPADRHFPEDGFFDRQRAGFHIDQYPVAAGMVDTLTASIMLAERYADTPPGGGSVAHQFGPWLPHRWLPTGIFLDHDGDPDSEALLQAWYGFDPAVSALNWMYGANRSPDSSDDFEVVADEVFAAWIKNPGFFEDSIDDLVNLNLNYIVTVGDVSNFPDWDGSSATFTIRVTPKKDTSATPPPSYADKTPVPSLNNTDPVGVITISSGDTFTPGEVLEISVSDGNVVASDDGMRTVAVLVTSTLGESETLTLQEVTQGRGVFTATVSTVAGDAAGGGKVTAKANNNSNNSNNSNSNANNGKGNNADMVAVPGTRLRFTYRDDDDGKGGNGGGNGIPRSKETIAIATSSEPPEVSGGGGGGGGCTVGNGNRANSISLPLLVLLALCGSLLRRVHKRFTG
jgi:hypothetical protein